MKPITVTKKVEEEKSMTKDGTKEDLDGEGSKNQQAGGKTSGETTEEDEDSSAKVTG